MSSPFNEAKYKALLEGLEVSEINKSKFLFENTEFRLDAEYFSKVSIFLNQTIDKIGFDRIGDFAFVTDGIHTSIDYSENSMINLISATSPKENYFDLSRGAFISKKSHLENPRTALKEQDIILSTVGTIGNCAVVTKNILPANSDRHVGIIRISNDSYFPNYLSTFLLSKYGRFQTLRESTGNVQLNLFIYRIKTLKIAKLSFEFQKNIDFQIAASNEKRILSQQTYRQAEEIFLETIGLKDFQPSQEGRNIKSFKESFLTTGRLDAEYYQPKYEEIIAKVKQQQYDLLGNIVKVKKSIEPGSDVYSEEGLPFIRVSDYNKYGISTPGKCLSENYCKENADLIKVLYPKKETILFSKDGSVGTAYMLRESMQAVTSGAILHLTVKDKNRILPEYLTLALNSEVVKQQAERDAGGSIILHWRVSEIEKVVVPIVDYKIQQQIATLIEESFRLRHESEQLLECAKHAVEAAIEKGEDEGIKILNKLEYAK